MEDGELAVPAGPGTRPKRDEGVGGRGQHPRGGGAAREKAAHSFYVGHVDVEPFLRLLGAPVTRAFVRLRKFFPMPFAPRRRLSSRAGGALVRDGER